MAASASRAFLGDLSLSWHIEGGGMWPGGWARLSAPWSSCCRRVFTTGGGDPLKDSEQLALEASSQEGDLPRVWGEQP